MDEEERIKKALLKKALGYNADEVVCEYVLDDDGQEKLAKKKVTRKHFAPDISAMKMLMADFDDDFDPSLLSDEELLQQKEQLLQILKEEGK